MKEFQKHLFVAIVLGVVFPACSSKKSGGATAGSTPSNSTPSFNTGNCSTSPTGTSQAQIQWSASTGATSYTVYVSCDNYSFSPGQIGSNPTPTSAVITGLNAHSGYYVRVKATNGSGTSSFSQPLQVTVP